MASVPTKAGRQNKALRTGLDRLLSRLKEEPDLLGGRRYALLAHGASVTADLRPAHLALAASAAGAPTVLLAPEHGYYGVEQDMVAASETGDPWTGARIESLYGDDEESLVPRSEIFDEIDLLIVDLQDVGSRYYTYAATAVWTAEVALEAGCDVWILDRPNPLGGEVIEGSSVAPGFESFVSAFAMPVRHGLTLGEIVRLEAVRRQWRIEPTVWTLTGWRRSMLWGDLGRPWIAPSPNMPSELTAHLYPGGCLVEATEISEGRGTTRPFQLLGAPGVDPLALAAAIERRKKSRAIGGRLDGLGAIPTYFRPQFQKHAGARCGGVELTVTNPSQLHSYRAGIEILAAFHEVAPDAFRWREAPYEFVIDRPAIDLLTGDERFRRALEGPDPETDLAAWIESWTADEVSFRAERRTALLYAEAENAQ